MIDDRAAQRISEWVVAARQARSWSRTDLVRESGVAKDTVAAVEHGEVGPKGWQPRTLARLEAALDAPAGTLTRVGGGEDVPIGPAANGNVEAALHELMNAIERLQEQTAAQDQRVGRLERRVDALEH